MGQETGAGLAAKGETDAGLRPSKPARASGSRGQELRQAFDEGATLAGGGVAAKAPDPKAEADGSPHAGQIGRTAIITAMDCELGVPQEGSVHVRAGNGHG